MRPDRVITSRVLHHNFFIPRLLGLEFRPSSAIIISLIVRLLLSIIRLQTPKPEAPAGFCSTHAVPENLTNSFCRSTGQCSSQILPQPSEMESILFLYHQQFREAIWY